MKDGAIVMTATREGGLYVVYPENINKRYTHTHTHAYCQSSKSSQSAATATLTTQQQTLRLLHQKLGHVSYTKLRDMIHADSIDSIKKEVGHISSMRELMDTMAVCECDGCMKGKMCRLPMTGVVDYRVHAPMDMWVADTVGPMKTESIDGHRYCLHIMDVHTRVVFAALAKLKSECGAIIVNTVKQQQTQTSLTLKRFHSDGGTELVNSNTTTFFSQQGTIFTTSVPYTPQHNGLVERANRTIIEMAKSMMFHARAYRPLWGEAFMVAAYLHRRLINSRSRSALPTSSGPARNRLSAISMCSAAMCIITW